MTEKEYDNFKIGGTVWYYRDGSFASSVIKDKKRIKGSFGWADAFAIDSVGRIFGKRILALDIRF